MLSTFSPRSFDAPDADVVIISGGEEPVEFRLHKCILTFASPFFRDMFSLPQPHPVNNIPQIPVPESAATWAPLLQFVYPIDNPHIDSLDDIVPLMNAALKYDFVAVINTLKAELISPRFLKLAPLRVYAIACQFELENEAKIASHYTLCENLLDTLPDDLKYITAFSYHQLLTLHRQRARAAQELLQPHPDLKCPQCNIAGHGKFGYPKWWQAFESKARQELSIRPTSDVIFEIHFLAQASATGCPRCPANAFEASDFLQELKRKIDDLPSTI